MSNVVLCHRKCPVRNKQTGETRKTNDAVRSFVRSTLESVQPTQTGTRVHPCSRATENGARFPTITVRPIGMCEHRHELVVIVGVAAQDCGTERSFQMVGSSVRKLFVGDFCVRRTIYGYLFFVSFVGVRSACILFHHT